MGLETVNENGNARLNELNTANPTGTDNKNQGDDHIRNIKKVIKDQFSGISGDSNSGAVTATAAELNKMDGCTATTADLNKLDGCTATTADLNILDGLTADTAELNKLDGCTADTAELNKLDGCTADTAELNKLDGCTATTAELNKLNGCTATTAELNTLAGSGISSATMTNLAGLTAHEIDTLQGISTSLTSTELNYVNGVTSSIQAQLNAKQANMSAGTNIDISGNTIHASGCPDVVVAGNVSTQYGISIYSSYNIPVTTEILDKTGGASVSSSCVYLPAGTYFFEGYVPIYNNTGSASEASLQLYTDGGTAIGTKVFSRVGGADTVFLSVLGTFTTTGDKFRLVITTNSSIQRLKYGYSTGTPTRQAHTIKFWRSDR